MISNVLSIYLIYLGIFVLYFALIEYRVHKDLNKRIDILEENIRVLNGGIPKLWKNKK